MRFRAGKPKLNKTSIVIFALHLLLIALIVYEVIFLNSIYRVWKDRSTLPSGVKTARINFGFYEQAEKRYLQGVAGEVPVIPVADPFNTFDPDPKP
jgi:hypothetical protein